MISLIFWVIVLGLLAYAVQSLPIPQPFKTVTFVLLVLVLVVVIFQAFGYAPLSHPYIR